MIADPWGPAPNGRYHDGSPIPDNYRKPYDETDHVGEFNEAQARLHQNSTINNIFGVNAFGSGAMPEAYRKDIFGSYSASPSVDPWTDLTPGGETRRYQNVPQAQSYQPSVTQDTAQDLGYGRKLMQMLGNLDERIQAVGRNAAYGARDRFGDSLGGYPRDIANTIGEFVHAPRSEFSNDASGLTALIASRGLQAGGITAAGAGLINLTHQMQNQFGGASDVPRPGTLPM